MVSIIILSYNTKELLRLCLTSVYEKLKNIPFEVIVVDNASKDGSLDMIQKEFVKVRLIQNKTNVGFAKGVNRGAKNAKGEYLLFLNSDAQIKDDTIKHMAALLEKTPSIGIVGGKLENIDGTTSQSYGSFYTIPSIISLLFLGQLKNLPSLSKKVLVDWVSGGFMLVRKSVFKQLHGFDEHFFMYVEDIEFCYRAKKKGYGVQFIPDAKAIHRAQGSSDRSFAIINIYKGLLYFYKKHKPFWEYVIVKILLGAKAIIAMIIGVLTFNSNLIKTYRKALMVSL